MELIEQILGAPPAPETDDVAQWWDGERARVAGGLGGASGPIARAVAGGLAADRLAWAMASGYQAALAAMIPGLPDAAPVAFCVSEAEGNSPRAIATTLRALPGGGYRLDGEKRWSTLGPVAGTLLIAARDIAAGDASRPLIRLVRVDAGTRGLAFTPMAEADFVPEVPHARLRIGGVRVGADAVFDGDAYSRYIKPFRSHEDVHVSAAMLAYLAAEGRRCGWPADWRECALAVLLAFESLARRDLTQASTHLALSGTLKIWSALAREAGDYFNIGSDDPAAVRWRRDARLLGLAARTRALRAERAWEMVAN